MNWEQVKGVVERGVYFIVMWALAKGWIPQAIAQDLIAFIVTFFGIIYGWWVNRQGALVAAAAAMPGVDRVVVNDRALTDLSKPDAEVATK